MPFVVCKARKEELSLNVSNQLLNSGNLRKFSCQSFDAFILSCSLARSSTWCVERNISFFSANSQDLRFVEQYAKQNICKDVDPMVKLGSQRGMTNPGQNGNLFLAPLKTMVYQRAVDFNSVNHTRRDCRYCCSFSTHLYSSGSFLSLCTFLFDTCLVRGFDGWNNGRNVLLHFDRIAFVSVQNDTLVWTPT